MAQQSPLKISGETQDLIIGAGLTGLLLQGFLLSAGRTCLLFEQKESPGGQLRKVKNHNGPLPSSLEWLPAHESSELWKSLLEELCQISLEFSPREVARRTYDHAHFHDFLGFGERPFKTVDFLSRFNSEQWLQPNLAPADWIEALIPQTQSETLSEVTHIEKSGEKYLVTVNGGKTIQAERVFFTPAPHLLLNLIPHDSMPSKFVTRLSRSEAWTMACLHLSHKILSVDPQCLYFFLGPKEDFEPGLGRFFISDDFTQSYWFTLISPESAEDNDYMTHAIKNLKKHLKRAFPEIMDSVFNEKISISSQAFGHLDLKLKQEFQLPDWPNFFLASHLFSSVAGPMAHVDIVLSLQKLLREVSPSKAPPSHSAEASL